MNIFNKEQMQELDQVADERLVWEYISCKNDIKKLLISATYNNKSDAVRRVDQIWSNGHTGSYKLREVAR